MRRISMPSRHQDLRFRTAECPAVDQQRHYDRRDRQNPSWGGHQQRWCHSWELCANTDRSSEKYSMHTLAYMIKAYQSEFTRKIWCFGHSQSPQTTISQLTSTTGHDTIWQRPFTTGHHTISQLTFTTSPSFAQKIDCHDFNLNFLKEVSRELHFSKKVDVRNSTFCNRKRTSGRWMGKVCCATEKKALIILASVAQWTCGFNGSAAFACSCSSRVFCNHACKSHM